MVHPVELVLQGGMIAANSLVVKYLFDLDKENCTCAMDYRRIYIIGYTLFTILSTGLSVIGVKTTIGRALFGTNLGLQGLFAVILLIAGIVNVVFVFQYVDYLKKVNCECSESVYKTLMQVIAGIQAATLGFVVFGILYVLVMIGALKSVQKSLKRA